jgi:hypothetical protein
MLEICKGTPPFLHHIIVCCWKLIDSLSQITSEDRSIWTHGTKSTVSMGRASWSRAVAAWLARPSDAASARQRREGKPARRGWRCAGEAAHVLCSGAELPAAVPASSRRNRRIPCWIDWRPGPPWRAVDVRRRPPVSGGGGGAELRPIMFANQSLDWIAIIPRDRINMLKTPQFGSRLFSAIQMFSITPLFWIVIILRDPNICS